MVVAGLLLAASAPAHAGTAVTKRALVISNANYANARLKNPPNDATSIAKVLSSIGFSVARYDNLTRRGLRKATNAFVKTLGADDVALVFYAGHAVELKGKNYLLPVKFEAENEDDAVDEAYALDTLMGRLSRGRKGVNIVILDACRDDPFTRS